MLGNEKGICTDITAQKSCIISHKIGISFPLAGKILTIKGLRLQINLRNFEEKRCIGLYNKFRQGNHAKQKHSFPEMSPKSVCPGSYCSTACGYAITGGGGGGHLVVGGGGGGGGWNGVA